MNAVAATLPHSHTRKALSPMLLSTQHQPDVQVHFAAATSKHLVEPTNKWLCWFSLSSSTSMHPFCCCRPPLSLPNFIRVRTVPDLLMLLSFCPATKHCQCSSVMSLAFCMLFRPIFFHFLLFCFCVAALADFYKSSAVHFALSRACVTGVWLMCVCVFGQLTSCSCQQVGLLLNLLVIIATQKCAKNGKNMRETRAVQTNWNKD